jgi:predicted O-methyltransferase YrrM
MSQEKWSEVDRYLCEHLLAQDPVLDEVLRVSAEHGLPSIAVSPNQGKLLALLVRAIGARRILEIGTLGAYSTIWLARALPDDGRLITLEAAPTHAEVAQANLERAGVSDRVEIRLAPALESLEQLSAQNAGPFDFVFIDADKENTKPYFEWSIRLTRPGSLIVVDNVVRSGRIVDAGADSQVDGMRAFFDYVKTETRVDASAIQTVGSKGYDGFALARVLGP